MKIKCDFCKTEYNLDRAPVSPVQCAVCGHTWSVSVPARRANMLMFFAACCAVLAALVFVVVVMTHQRAQRAAVMRPLVATVDDVAGIVDDAGAVHFVVSGTITNRSDEIYGVPDLIIVSHDAHGDVVARQKFLPTATLIDPGRSVSFSHMLAVPAAGVKKISVELSDVQIRGWENDASDYCGVVLCTVWWRIRRRCAGAHTGQYFFHHH